MDFAQVDLLGGIVARWRFCCSFQDRPSSFEALPDFLRGPRQHADQGRGPGFRRCYLRFEEGTSSWQVFREDGSRVLESR